MKIQFYMK